MAKFLKKFVITLFCLNQLLAESTKINELLAVNTEQSSTFLKGRISDHV